MALDENDSTWAVLVGNKVQLRVTRSRVSGRLALLLASLLSATAFAADRFAVVVGSNEGNARRAKLWFAEKDAERFASTLKELGDFDPEHLQVLRGATADQVREALSQMEAKIARARQDGHRTLLVFYFSGHAGAGALELGADHLDFADLKSLVEG